jgi:hypothetical protein
MNLSWSDLNNVREAGDYPFRDGTITVTFAEIAIWKNDPQAIFQVMRKHPVQGEFRYVLGRQIEERPAPAETKLIHESSNGDAWYLTRNAETGARAVMHRPTPQSGGQVSYIAIENFLSEGTNGPEHQALRGLMATITRVPTLLIGYDVHPPEGEAHDALIRAIQSLGTWWHHLETIWIVQCAHTPAEVRDRLKSHLGIDDQLLVIDISGDAAGWIGVNESGSKWLADNI